MPRAAVKPRTKPAKATAEPLLTLDDVLAELRVSERTFRRWRQAGTGPKAITLPGRELRFRRGDVDAWLASLGATA
jgi:predicted DNA-binding transcriptional regulator AlpA